MAMGDIESLLKEIVEGDISGAPEPSKIPEGVFVIEIKGVLEYARLGKPYKLETNIPSPDISRSKLSTIRNLAELLRKLKADLDLKNAQGLFYEELSRINLMIVGEYPVRDVQHNLSLKVTVYNTDGEIDKEIQAKKVGNYFKVDLSQIPIDISKLKKVEIEIVEKGGQYLVRYTR